MGGCVRGRAWARTCIGVPAYLHMVCVCVRAYRLRYSGSDEDHGNKVPSQSTRAPHLTNRKPEILDPQN